MTTFILPSDPVANNKACSNKNDKHNVPVTGIASMVGVRHQETKLDLRFYDFEKHNALSNKDRAVLCEW